MMTSVAWMPCRKTEI